MNFMEWLGENQIPFSIIFTKADKLKPAARERNIKAYTEKMLATLWEELPPIFITSSLHKTGGEEILEYIHSLNESLSESIQS
jgi:GTP-binding protein